MAIPYLEKILNDTADFLNWPTDLNTVNLEVKVTNSLTFKLSLQSWPCMEDNLPLVVTILLVLTGDKLLSGLDLKEVAKK